MTLACKTADLLSLATQGLNHLITGQDVLVTADERNAALTQLAVTVRAAAKLADVVHMEAQGASGTGVDAVSSRMEVHKMGKEVEQPQRNMAETEKSVTETARLHAEVGKVGKETESAKAEWQKAGKEAERAVAETERLKAEAIMVRSEKLKIDVETERMKVEMEMEVVNAGKHAERAVAETERVKPEAMMVRSEKIKIDPETESVKADEQQSSAESETVLEKVESSEQVPEGHGPQPVNYLEVLDALDAQIEQVWTEIEAEPSFRKIAQLCKELAQLKSERERWMLRQASGWEGIS